MVIFHRKSGYTVAEETTGGRLTLCACAQLRAASDRESLIKRLMYLKYLKPQSTDKTFSHNIDF